MKETINVSIAGIAFILDKDCYALLNQFLIGKSSDCELTIAQQILSVQDANIPVSIGVLSPIIDSMGGIYTPPTDLVQDAAPQIGKHLYRNHDGAILGGVCNGLASFFNTSVVLFRLLFIIPFFIGGVITIWDFSFFHFGAGYTVSMNATAVIIYMVLWIVIPKARTPLHRIQMQQDKTQANSSGAIAMILKVIGISFAVILVMSTLIALGVSSAGLSIEIARNDTPIPMTLQILGLSYTNASLIVSSIVMLPILAIGYLILSAAFTWRNTKTVIGVTFLIWFAIIVTVFVLIMSNITPLMEYLEYWNH